MARPVRSLRTAATAMLPHRASPLRATRVKCISGTVSTPGIVLVRGQVGHDVGRRVRGSLQGGQRHGVSWRRCTPKAPGDGGTGGAASHSSGRRWLLLRSGASTVGSSSRAAMTFRVRSACRREGRAGGRRWHSIRIARRSAGRRRAGGWPVARSDRIARRPAGGKAVIFLVMCIHAHLATTSCHPGAEDRPQFAAMASRARKMRIARCDRQAMYSAISS